MTTAYYRGAMLVYDITFQQVARWVDELRAHADKSIVVICSSATSQTSAAFVPSPLMRPPSSHIIACSYYY
jgi:hypothetical protein